MPINMAATQEAVVATTIGSVGCESFPLCTPQPDLVPPAVTLGAAKTHDERDTHCYTAVLLLQQQAVCCLSGRRGGSLYHDLSLF